MFSEIDEVLRRPKFASVITGDRRAEIAELLTANAVWFAPTIPVLDCRDAKDNKYLELALAASADVIVSGDADLLDLAPWRGVRIVRAADYLTPGDG